MADQSKRKSRETVLHASELGREAGRAIAGTVLPGRVTIDRYGKADNTDRLGHAPAGIAHAKRGWEPHTAAGGPAGAPVYVSIDDDSSHDQDKQLVATYLRAREPVLGHWRAGRLRELQDHRLRRCRTAPGRLPMGSSSRWPASPPRSSRCH